LWGSFFSIKVVASIEDIKLTMLSLITFYMKQLVVYAIIAHALRLPGIKLAAKATGVVGKCGLLHHQ
jgi:hypothetical protein